MALPPIPRHDAGPRLRRPAVAGRQEAFTSTAVGLVFQEPGIQLFSATVLDQVFGRSGPLQLGLTTEEVRERWTRPWGMEIAHLADRAPFELRAARRSAQRSPSVLSLRPEVLLLEEPTASLEPRTKWVLVI